MDQLGSDGRKRSRVRVLVVDECAFVRDAIRLAIDAEERLELAADASTAAAALVAARSARPDVVVAEYQLPDAEAPELIAALRSERCDAEVVVLTGQADRRAVRRSMDCGARAFLTKRSTGVARLGRAVVNAADGIETLSNDALALLVSSIRLESLEPTGEWTKREYEVLRLAAQGASNAEIAHALYLSESTVKYHVGRLLEKTGARNRAELVAFAYRDGHMDYSSPKLGPAPGPAVAHISDS
jgi:DNA-binding NarL/FixJ family response regulator